MFLVEGKYTSAKVFIDDIEPECLSQVICFLNHPAFTELVAVMPDTHAGKGSVIGFTMPITDKLIPNVVGSDINCAVLAVNIGSYFNTDLAKIDHDIREKIPFGARARKKMIAKIEDILDWKRANKRSVTFTQKFNEKFGTHYEPVIYGYGWFENKCKQIGIDVGYALNSIGTLGGGNHYIEVGKSTTCDDVWFFVHSGSRNFGLKICNHHQNIAVNNLIKKRNMLDKKVIEKLKSVIKDKTLLSAKIAETKREMNLDSKVSKALAYLEGQEMFDYLSDMVFTQEYAMSNRWWMGRIIIDILGEDWNYIIETPHNYIDFRDFIIRKGAIRSYTEEKMIIPLNMRDGCLLCEGKSNPEWNYSAPHGAGRLLSRSKAKEILSLEDFKDTMQGIFSTSVDSSTLDEAPGAYKDSEVIKNAIEPTVTIIDQIKPVINLKENKGLA